MKQSIRLSYNGQDFEFVGAAHIGRATEKAWRREDVSEHPAFSQLEAIVCLTGDGAGSVSRNHAAIYPDEDGNFYVVDLGSSHGTKVNGRPIRAHERLYPQDKILLGERVELKVESIQGIARHNYALLVGHEGGNLKGVRADLEHIAKQLERRGFEGNIRQLYNGDATRSNLLSYLDSVAENATRYSHFIFHYSGHGSRSGLCLGIMGLGTVTPENFYAALAKIKGKKAVILDCCHAGVFINENNKKHMPDNTLVLAASSEQGKAYEPQDWAVAGGKHMGRFTSALVRYLDNHTHRLNLRDFEREIQREFPPGFFGYYCQEPQVTGDAFTMLTVRVR